MTYAERQEKGSLLCQKLGETITRIGPFGLRKRDRTYQLVDGPMAEFMVELSSWEVDPSDTAMQRVHDRYGGVVEAWRCAAAEYVAERSEA